MSSVVEGVDVSTCEDQNILEHLMDILDLDRIEERKIVRTRLLNLKAASRSKLTLAITSCLVHCNTSRLRETARFKRASD